MNKLFRALIHGLSSPSEVLRRPGLSPRLVEILTPLVALEGGPEQEIDFLRAYQALDKSPDSGSLIISNRVDFSEFELAYLFQLAELGVPIRIEFPVDSSGQGFDLPVNYLVKRLKQRPDLKNIHISFKPMTRPQRLVRYEAPDLVQEARFVAQVAAGYGENKKIAVALRVLDKRALVFRDALRAHGLDGLLYALPDLMGMQFDLVVIADCVHGRLTLSREPDWPLTDADCREINHLMGRPILRCFEEDWKAPSLFPARQALEPMWFLGACSAACELLILTSSMQDENGQAQVMSELAKLEWLGKNEGISQLHRPLNRLEQIFQNAKSSVALKPVEPAGVLDKTRFRAQFGDLLGLKPERPLSATRIEAFAHCRFRAFIEKLLKIDLNPKPKNDIDMRILGQLAHKALEQYYRDGIAFEQTLEAADPKETHLGVWRANLIWLEEALERLVSNLSRNPVIEDAKPVAFEYRPKAWQTQIGEDLIYINGIIDRVDESPDVKIVIDYKMSALSALKMRFAAKEILKTHFQIPIYLRLLESDKKLVGYPISIKEGAPGPLIEMTDRMPELDQALDNLLKPVLEGFVPPDIQIACGECRLKRVCRV